MANATEKETIKITGADVKARGILLGWEATGTEEITHANIRAAYDACTTDDERKALRADFMRGGVGRMLARYDLARQFPDDPARALAEFTRVRPTVAYITRAVEVLDLSVAKRAELAEKGDHDAKRAYQATATKWHRHTTDPKPRASGAGRPEGTTNTNPNSATDAAGIPLSVKVAEAPAVIPANPAKRKLATTMQGWLAVKEMIAGARVQAEDNPAAYATPMLQALSRIDREWDKVKPAE